ncbi:UDP-forming cellulose synthase catalytic subunit [Microvirga lotononidis]|uniref:Cellulose synthase catalytic subunit [UDP-forming] n=1 Tax=Microvirga lotononidis TaxID=864069 RepID=I4YT33_9HYPH|nr:UDP-forming cellulose synthase catalytic subunit [Microvirga lotononidis]EIM27125.1 cellulose synthase catalytic subunit (UDP-forming) [Microvirga lotononidis]WQO28687.1 UDP-forming cellulose synthase catalytic subunit [Microvirga lotononidis]
MRAGLIVAFWAVAAVLIISIVALPISIQAHLVAGLTVVACMIILKFFRAQGIWRLIALALGTAIVLRYVFWRTTSTIPPITEIASFIPGFLLYLAEMYSVMMLFLSLFVVSSPLKSRKAPQIDPENLPTVDVFVPTYNEGSDLLATTLAAAKAMTYPADKFTVWLLDDGGTDEKCNSSNAKAAQEARERRAELQALCEVMDVKYLTRARNLHAKAGNLNNGLENSTGDLVAVFDADHAPARSFLMETVGYFTKDKNLFLVQTPHFFINPDPLERNLGTFQTMPSENEMFYGVIQRGLDKWDAAFFCGSAAVLRREALQETNGFSGVSITEDCETALELHSRGWTSVYVDKPLIAGLQPDSFASFIGQRSRWAQGMMQILRYKFPPLKRGLKISQRLCYMSSSMFWLFPFSRFCFLISPLCYLFFSLEIFTASGGEFLAYTFTYMMVNFMMQNYLYGRYRWPWISDLYEYIQTIYLLPAVLSVIANPSKPTFKVTAKNESMEESRVSELGTPYFIIFGILILGVIATGIRVWAEPYKADLTLVTGAWNVLNLIIAGCALGVVSERATRRHSHRVRVERPCRFIIGDEAIDAVVRDVSVGGARVHVPPSAEPKLKKGAAGTLEFQPFSNLPIQHLPMEIRKVGMDDKGLLLGCRFLIEKPEHRRMIADLVFANADQWSQFQKNRHHDIGVLRGTLWFFMVAFYQTGRGLSYFFGLQKIGASKPSAPSVASAAK